jgi:hypothetical protein
MRKEPTPVRPAVAAIEARFAYLRREKIALSLLWMAKFGVVRITGGSACFLRLNAPWMNASIATGI